MPVMSGSTRITEILLIAGKPPGLAQAANDPAASLMSANYPSTAYSTPPPAMTALGLVSRASPVQTASRNCMRDEGGPFGFGDQVADPKPPQAAAAKSRGSERCGNARTMIPAGTVERGERKRTK